MATAPRPSAPPTGLTSAQVQALAALADEVSSSPGLPTLVARVGTSLAPLLAFEQLALAMRGADGRMWALIRPRASTASEPGWVELSDADNPLESAMQRGVTVRIDRSGTHLLPPGLEALGTIADLSTFPGAICVPIRGPDGPLGALGVFSSRSGAYSAGDASLLQIVGLLVETAARKLVLIDELATSEAERQRIEKLRGELTQLIVHDLKNPITVLESGLDYLQAKILPAALLDGRGLVESLKVSTGILGDLVNNMLDIARLEEGTLELKREGVALRSWIENRLSHKAPAARAAEVKLIIRVEPANAQFQFDQHVMGRVLDNLLLNALRYTPKQGQIAVVARVDVHGLTLCVGDTGPNAPADVRDRLFTKYGQLVGTERQDLPRASRGLGLYFCKLAVDLHGGKIRLEEVPKAGALFRIELPATSSVAV